MAINQNIQTNEHKRVQANAKKPTVTKATVTKSNAQKQGTGSKPNAGTKPGTGSKPNMGTKSGTGNKPNTGIKPGTGNKPNAAGNRSVTGKSGVKKPAKSLLDSKKNDKRNTDRNRRKKRSMSGSGKSLIAALLFGIIMALIITCIMRGSMLSTTQIAGEYYLDTNFDIYNFVEPKNEKAVLIFDNSSFQPDGIGDYEIEYTVQCGKLKTDKKITIHVADADTPLISGPDQLTVLLGEEIHWADFYQVTDSQPGLAESLTASPEIDTGRTGTQTTTLKVVDWYNNSSTKDIQVLVQDLQGKYYYAAKAARQYKLDMGISTNASVLFVYPKDHETYVLADSDIVYTVAEDGSCSTYEYDAENDSEVSAFSELVTTIKENGEEVNILSVSDFK